MHRKADGRFSYSSAWPRAYGLPLFGLEGCGIFPIVSNGDSTVLLQIMVSRLLFFGSLSRKLASRQVASTIPDSKWLLAGQEPALPTQCFLYVHSPDPPPEATLVIVRRVRRMLSGSMEMSDPT